MICSHFSVNSATLVATASSFLLLSNCRPASFTFAGACVLLRNQFVVGGPRRRDYSAPPAVFGLSHSRRHWTRFEVYTQPAGFLTKQATSSGMFTIHRQVKTHGHNAQANTNAANQQVPKTASVHYKTAKWYNDKIPINATH